MSCILTVSQVNAYVASKITSDLKLKGIAVKGEISSLTVNYRSGHMYFTLKDDECVLKAVMFASAASKLKFTPETGMKILAVGNITVYEKGGVYQLIVNELTPSGIGEQALQLQALKEKLVKKGVFAKENKKKIPVVPKKIAAVTSLSGAALHDIISVIQRRYPVCTLEVYPAGVQGSEAADSICTALKKADKSGADTIIITRGGGSAEDLSVFNNESVVMAVAECSTPVISAVGHEVDTTLCDYAADARAPTPSAAAEIAVPDKTDYVNALNRFVENITQKLFVRFDSTTDDIKRYEEILHSNSPERRIEQDEKLIDASLKRINFAALKTVEKWDNLLERTVGKISALSPFNTLKRGYSIVEKDGISVRNSQELAIGDNVEIRFGKGKAKAQIQEITTEE